MNPQQYAKRAGTCYRNWQLWRRGSLPLDNIVTHDQTWIFYDGRVTRKQWLKPGEAGVPIPKRNIHGNKQMLCLYWCVSGPLYWKLLAAGETFNTQTYCTHLNVVDEKIREMERNRKWDGRIKLLQDNARPHKSRISTAHVKDTLDWDVVEHPPYSPDIAPSDYHVFLSLKNFLRGKRFRNQTEVEAALRDYFDSKETEFWTRGIKKLPKRWLQVYYNRGDYLLQ